MFLKIFILFYFSSDNDETNTQGPGKNSNNTATAVAVVVCILFFLVIFFALLLFLYRRKYINLKHRIPPVAYFDSTIHSQDMHHTMNGRMSNGIIANNAHMGSIGANRSRTNPTYQITHPHDQPQYHVIENLQNSDDEGIVHCINPIRTTL